MPLPLHIALGFSDSGVKSGFTVVFIVWHNVAIVTGGCIIADAFSREWSLQLAYIVPGSTDTDRVSIITSGYFDRAVYLSTRHCSGTFKIRFFGFHASTFL